MYEFREDLQEKLKPSTLEALEALFEEHAWNAFVIYHRRAVDARWEDGQVTLEWYSDEVDFDEEQLFTHALQSAAYELIGDDPSTLRELNEHLFDGDFMAVSKDRFADALKAKDLKYIEEHIPFYLWPEAREHFLKQKYDEKRTCTRCKHFKPGRNFTCGYRNGFSQDPILGMLAGNEEYKKNDNRWACIAHFCKGHRVK